MSKLGIAMGCLVLALVGVGCGDDDGGTSGTGASGTGGSGGSGGTGDNDSGAGTGGTSGSGGTGGDSGVADICRQGFDKVASCQDAGAIDPGDLDGGFDSCTAFNACTAQCWLDHTCAEIQGVAAPYVACVVACGNAL